MLTWKNSFVGVFECSQESQPTFRANNSKSFNWLHLASDAYKGRSHSIEKLCENDSKKFLKNLASFAHFRFVKVIFYNDCECKQLSSFRYLHYCLWKVSRPLFEMLELPFIEAFDGFLWLLEIPQCNFISLHVERVNEMGMKNEKSFSFLFIYVRVL